ncbi:hypothetical protein N8529_00700 [bacterium]|nr:hypothetical protein [bacterium]
MSHFSFRDLAPVLAAAFLVSCPGNSDPATPKADIEKVTITVVDRIGNPLPNRSLEMRRKYQQAMSLQPYERVGIASTDENGIAVFETVKEEDWVSLSSDDNQFSGSITLEKGKTDYLLEINGAVIGSTQYSSEVWPIEPYEGAAARVRNILDRILSFYVEMQNTEFHSPAFYLEKEVINESEAKFLVAMGSLMNDTDKGINFGWGDFHARVSGLDKPITWVDSNPFLKQ